MSHDPIANLLDRLSNVTTRGKGWKATCPAHDDGKPSLDIDRGDDGRALVICRSGCTTDAVVKALGLTLADLMPANGVDHAALSAKWAKRGGTTKAPPGKIAATYDYHDADGALLFQVVRFDPKDFRQRRPDGKGGWTWKLDGTPRPLYRLPAVARADAGALVFSVEGEKDADRLAGEGLIATTTSGGAGNAHHTDLTPLHGRHVVIIPDADDAGRNHARELIEALVGKASSVRLLELSDLPPKGDASDWFNAGHDAEELVRLAEAAPVLKAGDVEPAGDAPIIRMASDVAPRAVSWLWPDVFVGGAINLAIGMPDVGKTVLSCDLAGRVTTGTPWPPLAGVCAPNVAGSVAFLSAEDSPEATLVPRLREAGADLRKVAFVEGVARLDRDGSRKRDSFDIARDVRHLEHLRATTMPDLRLVIVDPLDSYINGKVNTGVGNEVRAALWPLRDWCETTGCTVLVLHHFNKASTTNAMDRVSGARSFGALPRSVWAIGRDPDDDERTIFAPIKLNLIRHEDKRSRAYRIVSSRNNPAVPVITWLDETVDINAASLVEGKAKTQRSKGADWLADMLADGPMPADELRRHAEDAGMSWRTLEKAKDEAGVVSERHIDPETKRVQGWRWRLR
jgi:hypothetical protein